MVKTLIFATRGSEDDGGNYKKLQEIVENYGAPIFKTDTVSEWCEHEEDRAALASLYQVDEGLVSIISMGERDMELYTGDIVKLGNGINPKLEKELVDYRDRKLRELLPISTLNPTPSL